MISPGCWTHSSEVGLLPCALHLPSPRLNIMAGGSTSESEWRTHLQSGGNQEAIERHSGDERGVIKGYSSESGWRTHRLRPTTAANHELGWFSGGTPTPSPEPMPIWIVAHAVHTW